MTTDYPFTRMRNRVLVQYTFVMSQDKTSFSDIYESLLHWSRENGIAVW